MTEKEERLKKLDTNKLIDVVKNYRQYGYGEDLRNFAISILEERGITKEELQLGGNFTNTTYDYADEQFKLFSKNSKIAFALYGLAILTNIILPVFLIDLRTFGLAGVILVSVASLLYLIFLIKAYLNQTQFYKAIGQEYGSEGAFVYLFFGMTLYLFMYFYFRNQMREKMKEIR